MANWKKVIVSGSAAHLLNVTASNLTNDNLVIAGVGGALESSGLTYNGSVLNLGSSQVQAAGFSGSFSGSFQGDGSQLTGVVASSAFSLTNATGEGISAFSYNGTGAATVAVSGAADLNANAITKWDNTANKFANSSLTDNGNAITGTTSIQLTGANSSLTGSFTGSFIGDGSGLTGLPTTLTVDGDTGTENVNLITDDLQIIGTANEIETAVTKVGTDVKVTIGLPNDVIIGNNLTVTNDLIVNGNTTYINTTNLYVEDPFVLLASGSGNNGSDGGIVIDRGGYSGGNVAIAYDKQVVRWGFQNGLADSVTDVTLADGSGTSAAFAGLVFTEAAHGATKPVTGEFAVQGAIYTATNEDIWIYS